MRKPNVIVFGYLLLLCILCFVTSTVRSASASPSPPKDKFFGISPEDQQYYKSSEVIKCRDGSKKFSKTQLNDDFCDCPDGTDEPGTSACPNGKFYCRNAGHVPVSLYSSRVNDGICDCCDGSDEYDGKVECPNICWEAGKVARDKLNKKITTYQEGVAIRKQEIEQAKIAMDKDKAELSKLQNEEKILKGLVQQLKDRKEQIEKAEEKERLRREKEEAEKKGVEEKGKSEEDKQEKSELADKVDGEEKQTEATHEDTIGILDGSPKDAEDDHSGLISEDGPSDASNNEGLLVHGVEKHVEKEREESSALSDSDLDVVSKASADEVKDLHNDASKGTDAMTREELGRLVASRWTGENTGKQAGDSNAENENNHDDQEEISKDTHDKEDDGYASETDDDGKTHDYDPTEDEVNEDFEEEDHDDSSYSYKSESDAESDIESDITTTTHPSWLEKIQQTVRSILQAVNLFQTPVNQSEAAQVRKEYDDSSAKLSKIQARISSLTQKLKHDFGPDKEFYSFYGRCFESKQNKYVYKVCPYKQASQLEGHSTTRLGEWEKFEGSYRVMVFSNGDKCWNGPDRSLKVKVKCGLKNEVTDVDEPSRCEYAALLSTPALCTEEKLKELQHKLDSMNKEPQQDHHDEL